MNRELEVVFKQGHVGILQAAALLPDDQNYGKIEYTSYDGAYNWVTCDKLYDEEALKNKVGHLEQHALLTWLEREKLNFKCMPARNPTSARGQRLVCKKLPQLRNLDYF